MGMFDIFAEIQKQTALPMKRYTNRLLGLEDTIILAKPDYLEAAESILSPMMAALWKRYERSEHRQEYSDVEQASEKLRAALMKADQAEQE